MVKAGVDGLRVETRAIKDDMSFIRDTVPLLHAKTTTIRIAQLSQQHHDLMQWLSRTDYPAQQHSILSQRQDGTAQWFLDSTEFMSWIDGTKRILFCPGIPGAGKTMIVAIGINYLMETRLSDDNIGIAYVFCSYKAELEQSETSLIAALLKQLVQFRPDLTNLVQTIYNNRQGGKATLEDLYDALKSVCLAYDRVYLLVDALDEYDDKDKTRSSFIDRLFELQQSKCTRILATSRFLPAIVDRFGTALTLEVRASHQDIQRYVKGQMLHLPRCVQKDEALQEVIIREVADAADGM